MQQQLKILGIVCLVLGIVTATVCFYSLALALPIGFLGMIGSSTYIYIDTKNQINTSNITPGIISLILSSLPVLLILTVIAYTYFTHTH